MVPNILHRISKKGKIPSLLRLLLVSGGEDGFEEETDSGLVLMIRDFQKTDSA
jgi:hypothetical protein